MPLPWPDVEALPDEWFDSLDTTREAMRDALEQQLIADARAPQIGDAAPDFKLPALDRNGELGDGVRLSALRDQPVALLFGSYT